MVPLLILGIVGTVVALATVAVFLTRRSRDSAPLPAEPADHVVLVPAGPVQGFASPHGPQYAPQPVFGMPMPMASAVAGKPSSANGYQPHRPVLTKSAAVHVQPGGGAHRRESVADEVARLTALHRAGALSDNELASLKARLA